MTVSKRTLRDEARARRAELARAVPDFARLAAKHIELLALPDRAVVAGYVPIGDEADPRAATAVLAERGHRLALPCVVAKDGPLVFRAWTDGDPLRPGKFGIGEPLESTAILMPGVVLVPLLAFDSAGHRLGYGGGYYDRTLAALEEKGHVLAIGVGFAGQEAPALPRHLHDRPLDIIVTERGIRRF